MCTKPRSLQFSALLTGIEREIAHILAADTSARLPASLENLLQQLREWELEMNNSRQSFLDALPMAYMSLDQEGLIREVNSPLCKMLGCASESLTSRPATSIIPPESLDSFYGNTRSLFLPGHITEFETKLVRSDGTRFFAELRSADLSCFKDGMSCRGLVISDINKRKRIAGLLQDSEERFRLLYEQHPLAYLSMDENGCILEVNGAWSELLAYSRHETTGRNLADFVEEGRDSGIWALLREMGSLGDIQGRELELRHKDGRSVFVSISAKIVRRENGSFRQAHCVLTDITERRSMENERKRMVAVIEQAVEGVMITDLQGKILHVNPAFEKMSGYPASSVLGNTPQFLKSGFHGDLFYEKMWDTILKGEVWQGRLVNKHKDGTNYEADLTISPIRDQAGDIVNFVAVSHDVTEQLRLERHLRQSQKMEAIGTLAGGIAHDFNNILMALLGYAEMAKSAVSPDSVVQPYLAEILTSGERARELVRQILTFSRQTERGRHAVRVSLIIKEVLRLLRATLPSTIKVSYSIRNDGLVHSDPTEIHQVLMNLCTNAAYAMREKGGKLEVILNEVVIPGALANVPSCLVPGTYMRLLVRDTGCGMESAIVERIFEPFFTTKQTGEGTGMGLSVVHGIITDMNGGISVESSPGQGTSIWVFMPKLDGVIEDQKDVQTLLPKGSGQRILYVDDEKILGGMVEKILTPLGYNVSVMANGSDALAAFLLAPDNFDAVISDQTMPGLTGLQLAEELLRRKPDLPIILCTGYSELISKEKVMELGIREFFIKPVTSMDLASALARIFKDSQGQAENESS
ncbi:MAG: hypothetical protein A2X49_16985 [Lentisphaerae bacterium GWF2_52_8]|nr:MAG: hypothetical protein A2X49_16985 [Lentisphaerae bacterium GWF2_52_8]